MATIKTKVSEYIYQIGSDRQGSGFVVNTKFILNHMQSQFIYSKDFATALKNRTISRPLNLGRLYLKQKMEMQEEMNMNLKMLSSKLKWYHLSRAHRPTKVTK